MGTFTVGPAESERHSPKFKPKIRSETDTKEFDKLKKPKRNLLLSTLLTRRAEIRTSESAG